MPVYAWACLVTISIGFIGDRLGHRGYINMWVFPGAVARTMLTISIGFCSVLVNLSFKHLFFVPSADSYPGLAGYIILIASTNPSLSYFAVYLAASYVRFYGLSFAY